MNEVADTAKTTSKNTLTANTKFLFIFFLRLQGLSWYSVKCKLKNGGVRPESNASRQQCQENETLATNERGCARMKIRFHTFSNLRLSAFIRGEIFRLSKNQNRNFLLHPVVY